MTNDNQIFESYLKYIKTNPTLTLNAFWQYYKRFNIPEPTKEEILSIMFNTANSTKFSEKQQIKLKETINDYLSIFMFEDEE